LVQHIFLFIVTQFDLELEQLDVKNEDLK